MHIEIRKECCRFEYGRWGSLLCIVRVMFVESRLHKNASRRPFYVTILGAHFSNRNFYTQLFQRRLVPDAHFDAKKNIYIYKNALSSGT